MGMGFAPTWLRQVSPLLHKTTLTTGPQFGGTPYLLWNGLIYNDEIWYRNKFGE